MLSAEKVKLHGMRDPHWTTRDKVAQYKGLLSLYARDRIIIKNDTNVIRRKQLKELKVLRKDIKEKREELTNELAGDRQGLRNALADYRSFQLAYQGLLPEKVVEELKQANHIKRKQNDRFFYQKQQRSQVLIDLKLKLSELEDRQKYGVDPAEMKVAQVVIGKVQDALLKKEISITINRNFRNVLDIMKKDSLYFDAVLAALKLDSQNQGKCLYRTTQLGQLATEYLDDRVQDYNLLEKAIKKSMKDRERSIKHVRGQVKDLTNNLKFLISKESGTELNRKVKQTQSEIDLQRNLESMDSILKFLQETTMVSAFEEIYPRLEDQQYQKKRLTELVENYTDIRDRILKKRNHAELMYDTLFNTMADTTYMYKEEKKRLLDEIAAQNARSQLALKKIEERGEYFLVLRTSLQQIHEMLKCVSDTTITIVELDNDSIGSDTIIVPERPETDVTKLLPTIKSRLKQLQDNEVQMTNEIKLLAESKYQQALIEASNRAHESDFEKKLDVSLLEGLETEDPTVPTRAEIKKKSAFIVELCSKKDDDIPVHRPSRKKKKK